MKYIDAEKLLAEIQRRKKQDITIRERSILIDIETAIDSIQRSSLQIPNLDEAAEEYANRGISSNADPYEETIAYQADKEAFKAGAEWMAGQGITVDGTFHHSCGYPSVIELKTYLRDYEGADVTVQIRKKQ